MEYNEKLKIYEEIQHQLLVEECKDQIHEFFIISSNYAGEVSDKVVELFDLEELVDNYQKYHDSDIADNAQWQVLIQDAAENIPIEDLEKVGIVVLG